MNIRIKNFTNIKEASLDIEENKLNFIYGISGSGKTSISLALTTKMDELEKYKTFGTKEEVVVNLNKQINFEVFNVKAIEEYTFRRTGLGIYDVIYGENDELKALKEELILFLDGDELKDVRAIIERQHAKIELIQSALDIKTTAKGGLSKTGLFGTLAKPNSYYDSNPKIDASTKKWIKQGQSLIKDSICPFCEQNMVNEIVEKIIQISNELPEEFSRVLEAEKQLKSIGIDANVTEINKTEVQIELKESIENHFQILTEMKAISSALNISINDDKALEKKVNIKLSEDTIKIFSDADIDIVEIINTLRNEQEGYTKLKNMYNGKLKTQIKKNIRLIDQYFKHFGINYKFEKQNSLSRTPYSLVHLDSTENSSESLSTGEQNVISLILFVLAFKDKNIIIDDPASSFDEYRRERIIDFILRERYIESMSPKTTIILSHDQIFLKFLTLNYMSKDKYSKFIGSVLHFENNQNKCVVSNISVTDMGSISSHIIKQATASISYFQQILNLRLYFEHIDIASPEYGYLSKILHSVKSPISTEQFSKDITDIGTTEEKLIENIYSKTDIRLPLFKDSVLTVDFNSLSQFEQLCYVREHLQNREEKKELNNIVHFNYALSHLLNPYKFNFQSQSAYSILKDYSPN